MITLKLRTSYIRFDVHLDPVAGISAPTVSPADIAKLEKHFMSHRCFLLYPPKMQDPSNISLLQLGSLEWVHVRGGCHQVSHPHSGLHWEGHHCGWSGEEKKKGKGCWNKLFRWNWPDSSCCSRQITGEVWSGLTTSRNSTRPQDWLRQPSLFNSRPLKQRQEISSRKCDTSQKYLTALKRLKKLFWSDLQRWAKETAVQLLDWSRTTSDWRKTRYSSQLACLTVQCRIIFEICRCPTSLLSLSPPTC